MTREWDGATYDAIALPHRAWAQAVAARLTLDGDEVVVDAGAGSGILTRVVLERLPRGRIVAVDGSSDMLRQLADQIDDHRVSTVHGDLLDPLPVREVDAVVSSATFHWIADHRRLFANLGAALKPAGQLVAQCGGAGNIANVEAALDRVGRQRTSRKFFAGVADTVDRLAEAGFEEVDVWTTHDPFELEPGEALETYLATIALGDELEALPADQHAAFVHAIAGAMTEPVIDYVRLNITARRRR